MTANPDTVNEHLHWANRQFGKSSSPWLDAEVLLAHCLERPRSYLYAYPEARLEPAQRAEFRECVRRRALGEPVAYLTGRREFWSLDLEVSAATLIPRPDTELLVTTALGFLLKHATASVADLGTGSGAVALAIAVERPMATLWASDVSEAAVAMARRNRDRLGVSNVHLVTGSWYEALPESRRFEVIVSNPPYVAAGDCHLQEGDVRFEPRSALVAGADGLDDIRILVAGARQRLMPGGVLIVEHGAEQAEQVLGLMSSAGLQRARNLKDLAARPRVSLAHA